MNYTTKLAVILCVLVTPFILIILFVPPYEQPEFKDQCVKDHIETVWIVMYAGNGIYYPMQIPQVVCDEYKQVPNTLYKGKVK